VFGGAASLALLSPLEANERRQSGSYLCGRSSAVERRVDTMMLILTLAAGLLAGPEPQAEPQKGWVVEIHGYTYHRREAEPPKGEWWIIEVRGFTKHSQAEMLKGLIIEFQWPKAKPQIEPVEGQDYDDLSAFFKQWKVQVEPVEAFYVDDLRAFMERLKKEKP
jgi:hypothetical protein